MFLNYLNKFEHEVRYVEINTFNSTAGWSDILSKRITKT